ncbi:hypothetical protein [Undibacterium oligocarboniphilum]|uniref:Uncharacterized protein n=1 Tax=Undibacterium oligocarboniphilum TaxID=666702 RepID=A0A850QHC9_9BURK|nr:hypothetical protein [Undibacterium oligocarboniphilum]MBC3871433.1 hypothetical protein [Undibacterium oligocarboniphilum]NVO78991.1 hypothetical protein [Undibacterium oligocarboniphilum]
MKFKKPLLPVTDDWICAVNPRFPQVVFTPLILPVNLPDFSPDISVLGIFGKFMVVESDKRLFLIPNIDVAWLLWSFENHLESQFSNDERMALTGASDVALIHSKLKGEQQKLLAWLNSYIPATSSVMEMEDPQEIPSVAFPATTEMPEPIFFDEYQ